MENNASNVAGSTQQNPTVRPAYGAILRRRWWLILLIVAGAVGVALIGSLSAPPAYRSSLRLQVFVLDEQEITLYTRLQTAAATEQVFTTQSDFGEVLRSPLIAWRTINDLGLDMNANELLDRLTVGVSGEFVNAAYVADSPQAAQDILAQHVDNALDHYEKLRARPAVVTGQFLQAELESQEQALAATQDALLKFQLEYNVGDLLREINAAQDVLRTLEVARNAAQVEASRVEALAAGWVRSADEAAAAAATARQRLTELASPTAEEPLQGQALAAETAALQAEIAEQEALAETQRATAQTQAVNAAAQRAAIARQDAIISQSQADLAQLISLSSEYNALVAAVQNVQADYGFLRAKAVEARLKERQISDVGHLQVVEPAFLPAAAAPSLVGRVTLLAALLSLLAGLALALLLELASPTPAPRP